MDELKPKGPPPLPLPEPLIVAVPGPLVIKQRRAARSNYGGKRLSPPRGIVLHCTDGHEGFKKDDDVAAMFADSKLNPERSAGYIVDSDSVTQCVADEMIAWHCGATGNRLFLSVELCGFAKQTRDQWLDELSLPMLCFAARLFAELCVKHHIPACIVPAANLVLGDPGITTHAFVSEAFKQSHHTDPGPGFPLTAFVDAVARVIG